MKAVIQAGGRGARLRPYTRVLPKPLMPVGEMPVIELLLKWLRRNGITEVLLTIGYLGHLIKALCGDGRQWDMEIQYSEESEPLGTIGPLLLVRERLEETFLVLNGDLITDLDLRAFTDYHKRHGGLVTVAATDKKVQIDLGVIETEGDRIVGFQEKPVNTHTVSMGIYCLEPDILDHIPPGVPFGFDDLMHQMLADELPVRVFQHDGTWLDIGREEDIKKSRQLLREQDLIVGG